MSAYEKMSTEARSRLRKNGISFSGDKKKAKSWNLIWIYFGKEQIIMSNLPYAMCIGRENKLKKESQYRAGVFSIQGNY